MMGLREKPEGTPDKKFIPLERYGVKSMSIGYLVDEDAPIVWRGPMLHKVIEQFLKDVAWGGSLTTCSSTCPRGRATPSSRSRSSSP